MTISDPHTTKLIKTITEEGIATTKSFLEKLCGPAIEEAGLIFKDHVRLHRYQNQLRMLDKAQAIPKVAKSKVGPVPLRTLLPLLEGSGFENDENLSDKWAGLLASAASSVEDKLSHPSFPRILSEISSREGLILDKFYQTDALQDWVLFREALAKEFNTSTESINESYGNLARLGLCHIISPNSRSMLKLSSFGRFFLAAAYGPSI